MFLLEQFQDVLASGVRDQGNGDTHLPLMSWCWNHASYQELERQLPILRVAFPRGYRAVVGQYVYPRFVRRAVCRKCGVVKAPHNVGEPHRHPHRKAATFVARMVRVPRCPVAECELTAAVAWLDEHWRGDPYVPDELLPLVTAA